MNVAQRQEILRQEVAREVRHRRRVESQGEFQAVLVKGHRTNHILHLILTLLTFGLWSVIWVTMALVGGEKRRVIHVDEYGQIQG